MKSPGPMPILAAAAGLASNLQTASKSSLLKRLYFENQNPVLVDLIHIRSEEDDNSGDRWCASRRFCTAAAARIGIGRDFSWLVDAHTEYLSKTYPELVQTREDVKKILAIETGQV